MAGVSPYESTVRELLADGKGWTVRQVAEKLGCSHATAKKLVQRNGRITAMGPWNAPVYVLDEKRSLARELRLGATVSTPGLIAGPRLLSVGEGLEVEEIHLVSDGRHTAYLVAPDGTRFSVLFEVEEPTIPDDPDDRASTPDDARAMEAQPAPLVTERLSHGRLSVGPADLDELERRQTQQNSAL